MGLEELFAREVVVWRYMRALGCLLVLEVVVPMTVCTLYSTVVAQGTLSPVAVATNLLAAWLLPSRLLNLTIPALCFVVLARVHIKSYVVSAWVPVRRWEVVRRMLSLAVCARIVLVVAACALLANFYAALAHPSFPLLIVPCPTEDFMCRSRKYSTLGVGVCVGCCYAYRYFLRNGNLIVPAPVHPRKIQLVKSSLRLRNLREACNTHGASKFALSCNLVICLLFSVLMNFSMVRTWPELLQVFEVRLVVMVVLANVLLAITLFLFTNILHAFIAEPIEIPLASVEDNPGTEEDSWRLSNALSSSGLLQLLAFWDLKTVASADPCNTARRSQVFAISQPGGHPRNWLGIMNPSLNLIRKFCERLRRHNCPEDFPKPPDATSAPPTDLNKNEVVKPPPVPLKDRLMKVLDGCKKYPVFSYFLSELPDATNKSIFAESLPVIWAVQALSDIVTASFMEDKYGVVQRNIPDILMVFTQLQKVVDSVGRPSMTRRAATGDSGQAELHLKKTLKSALRSAFYQITIAFGPTILELQVSAECHSKLQSYLEFKES